MDIGLILSFSATLGIVFFYKGILSFFSKKQDEYHKKKDKKVIEVLKNFYKKIKEIISVSISAQILIFPLSIIIFNKISLTFLLSNILVSFIIGAVIILGFVSIIFRFKILFFILEILLGILIKIANIFSNIYISNIIVATPKLAWVIGYYLIIALVAYTMFLRKKYFKRRLETKFLMFINKFKSKILIYSKQVLISILLLLILINSIKLVPKDLKLHFIDVGQGDSCLIITPKNKTILIDGGGNRNSSFNIRKKYTTSIFVR